MKNSLTCYSKYEGPNHPSIHYLYHLTPELNNCLWGKYKIILIMYSLICILFNGLRKWQLSQSGLLYLKKKKNPTILSYIHAHTNICSKQFYIYLYYINYKNKTFEYKICTRINIALFISKKRKHNTQE